MSMQSLSKATINTKEFSSKFRSKGEVYRFVAEDVGAFVPPKESVTIYFLKDLITGKKKCKLYPNIWHSL